MLPCNLLYNSWTVSRLLCTHFNCKIGCFRGCCAPTLIAKLDTESHRHRQNTHTSMIHTYELVHRPSCTRGLVGPHTLTYTIIIFRTVLAQHCPGKKPEVKPSGKTHTNSTSVHGLTTYTLEDTKSCCLRLASSDSGFSGGSPGHRQNRARSPYLVVDWPHLGSSNG